MFGERELERRCEIEERERTGEVFKGEEERGKAVEMGLGGGGFFQRKEEGERKRKEKKKDLTN